MWSGECVVGATGNPGKCGLGLESAQVSLGLLLPVGHLSPVWRLQVF